MPLMLLAQSYTWSLHWLIGNVHLTKMSFISLLYGGSLGVWWLFNTKYVLVYFIVFANPTNWYWHLFSAWYISGFICYDGIPWTLLISKMLLRIALPINFTSSSTIAGEMYALFWSQDSILGHCSACSNRSWYKFPWKASVLSLCPLNGRACFPKTLLPVSI